MPRFIGAYVDVAYNQTAFKDLFEFNVIPPSDDDFDAQAVLPAFVTVELDETHIAEELARAYGALTPGAIIELTLQETLADGTIQRFALPVTVNFASRNRGSEYIQIGLSDLDEHFELNLYRPKPGNRANRFLEALRRPDSDRDCVEELGMDVILSGNPSD